MKKSYTPLYRYPNIKSPVLEGEKIENKNVIILDDKFLKNMGTWWPSFFPSVIGLLSSGDKNEQNIMAISCITVMNRTPFIVGMPLQSEDNPEAGLRPSHTLSLIEKTGEFALNIPHINPKLVKAISECGSYSGRDGVNKFEISGLTPLQGVKVKSPVIKECIMNFECTLHSITKLGSHSWLAGKVVAIHTDQRLAEGTDRIVWRSIPEMELVPK